MDVFDLLRINLIVVLLIGLFAFFIFREIMLWYWKINRIERLLEEQNDILSNLTVTRRTTGVPNSENKIDTQQKRL
ncbi:hypothetical protein RI065_04645 [Mycoplasmatota bacterium zrk1]